MTLNKKYIILLVFPLISILMMPGCIHDDFEEPALSDIPVGTVLTISELRAMFDDENILFDEDYSVYATVTMDDKSGNIYRSAFVQDETGAINLRLQAPGGIYQGDSVRIYLKGTILGPYQQMMQLDNVNVDKNIIKQANGKSVVPTVIRIPEINTQHQGMLIKLEDVQFTEDDIGKPFADSENLLYLNRTIEDCDGNQMIVRTSGYANFADELAPELNGSVVAILSQYRNDFQLFIRKMAELEMNDPRCGDDDDDDDDDTDPGEAVTHIDEDFQSYPDHSVINQADWTAYAEEGERNWICRTHQNNHYAQATAYNSSDQLNIMWMITPPIDLDAMTNPVFEFESAKAFYTHDGFSLYIATDFDGSDVNGATWQALDARLAGQGDPDNAWIHSGYIDLSSYSGIAHIAWHYEAAEPEGNTGTFRVDNVKLYED
jgi:hypothetical protein